MLFSKFIEYQAYELNPKNHFLQVEIGNLYALQNNFEEASGYFRRANRFFPDNKEIINGLIFASMQLLMNIIILIVLI